MRRLIVVALVAIAVIGACSDDGGGDSSDETTDQAPDAPVEEPTNVVERPDALTDVPPVSTDSVRAITLNQLHGLSCPTEDFCHAPDRVALLYDQIEAAGCPELVGLQEISTRQEELIVPSLDQLCGGEYELAWEDEQSQDRPMIFSRLPIFDQGFADLAAFPWTAYWVQVDSGIGTVDFLTTHLASSSNDPICDAESCPPVCPPGIRTNQCNGLEVLEFLDQNADPSGTTIVGGDFNARPGEPTIQAFVDAGYTDSWLAAGNAECDPATGVGCTGGGNAQTELAGLDDPTRLMSGRIDYLMVRAAPDCAATFAVEGFANVPLDDPIDGLFWVSDHTGLLGTVRCG